MMSVLEFILSILTMVISKTEKEQWIYSFLDAIGKGIYKFRLKRKQDVNFWYSTTFLEKDSDFNHLYLEKKIQDTLEIVNQNSITNPEYLEKQKQYLEILQYLQKTRKSELSMTWIEDLFPQKNKTACLTSDWRIPFGDYPKQDQEEFLLGESIKMKNYLFFLESIDNLMKSKINPFDKTNQQSFILVTTFENMLIKICGYSDIVISKSEIEKTKFKTLAKLI